jgi:hypothetical protein
VIIDGTLIETDRCRTPGPTPQVDLWWSGKHDQHGGNIQVITAPDRWPLWTSPVRPGRERDTTALREHDEMLPGFGCGPTNMAGCSATRATKARPTITVGYKKPKVGKHTSIETMYNRVYNALPAVGERGISVLNHVQGAA